MQNKVKEEAERKIKLMEEELQRKIQNEVQQKLREKDILFENERKLMNDKIDQMQLQQRDMQINMMQNEQVRKLQ